MRKIEIICYEQQSQSVEYTFKKYKIPFHAELTLAEEEKLLRYTGICPDSLSSGLTNELNKIIDTRRKELYVTSLAIEATLSDYLSNYVKELETKQVKVKKKKLIEEYEALIQPSVSFNKNLLFMIVIAAGVASCRTLCKQRILGNRCHADIPSTRPNLCIFLQHRSWKVRQDDQGINFGSDFVGGSSWYGCCLDRNCNSVYRLVINK